MNRKKGIRRKDMERIRLEQVQGSCLRQDSHLPKPCGGQVGRQVGGALGFGVLSMLMLVLLVAFSAGNSHAAAWAHKKQITINAAKVPSDQTDFPVLISITDTDLAADAQNDGNDICFTTDPNETNPANRLSHEIEYFDGGTGKLVAWVKIPSLSGSSDTQFYMHYGNPTCSSQENTTGVWDSHYKMVQHLEESPNDGVQGHLNSVSSSLHGTPVNFLDGGGGTTDAAGQINGADDFAGDDDYVEISSFDPPHQGTVSLWVKRGSINVRHRILGGDDAYEILFTTDNKISNQFFALGSEVLKGDTITSTTDWYYLAFTYDNSSSASEIFINGNSDVSGSTADYDPGGPFKLQIGIRTGNTVDYFDGLIDEVRISDIARSDNWITTSYNNQSDQTVGPGHFIEAVGSETDSSLPVELSSFTATAGDGKVTLHWNTESEIENLGFNIYRGLNSNRKYTIINNQLIPGAGNSSSRHEYEYVDKDLTNGITYWYKLEDVDYSGNTELHGPVSATPVVKAAPSEFCLYPNYPNPFNPLTVISYDLPKDGHVELVVYNMRGGKVTTLMKGNQEAGSYKVNWDGRNENGEIVSSGIYFLRIVSGSYSKTNKMIFIR
ncbi:MAG: DUF2341 domain-containing protein [Candidatus Marinimicrobia bacterium]|nr:DUF2341 domain-containing protein [Candidatus Neomarinimicrobiota bacterium]